LQFWVEATDRSQSLDLTLTEVIGLFRIWSGVPNFEKDRFTAIIRLGIKQHFGTGMPFAKDHKGRIDRNPAQPGIDARSALEGMAPQIVLAEMSPVERPGRLLGSWQFQ